MALFIDTETSGLPDTHNLRWGVYPDYWKLNKYENARIVQFSMLITDTQFKYEDVKDYIIKQMAIFMVLLTKYLIILELILM